MKTIFKYSIHRDQCINRVFTLRMPSGANILSLGIQGDEVVAWAIVDASQPLEEFKFYGVWTGFSLPPALLDYGYEHRATLQFPDGFVFHIFDGDDVDDAEKAEKEEQEDDIPF